MTSVLLTDINGEKVSVNALSYRYAECARQPERLRIKGVSLFAYCVAGDVMHNDPGGSITNVFFDDDYIQVKESPQEVDGMVNEAMRLASQQLSRLGR